MQISFMEMREEEVRVRVGGELEGQNKQINNTSLSLLHKICV